MSVVAMGRNPASERDIRWSFESTEDIASELKRRGVKYLVHAAWDMRANSSAELERICVNGSARLFQAARRANVRRIVFISTMSAFPNCRSAYGQSKLAVEGLLKGTPATIIRPGLVFGAKSGGVFGTMRQQIQKAFLVPLIGRGDIPQFLLHETTLAQCVLSAVKGNFDHLETVPITLAHPQGWPFKDLVRSISISESKNTLMIAVPWPVLLHGMRIGEALGLRLPFKSDSVVSFIFSDRTPDFSVMRSLNIQPKPYSVGINLSRGGHSDTV